MKEELRTQTVEIQKLRNNNRVLLGENLMLKQQQVTIAIQRGSVLLRSIRSERLRHRHRNIDGRHL